MADRKASVGVSKRVRPSVEPNGVDSRDSDRAPKPGFRAPKNTRSKAQKKAKKK